MLLLYKRDAYPDRAVAEYIPSMFRERRPGIHRVERDTCFDQDDLSTHSSDDNIEETVVGYVVDQRSRVDVLSNIYALGTTAVSLNNIEMAVVGWNKKV